MHFSSSKFTFKQTILAEAVSSLRLGLYDMRDMISFQSQRIAVDAGDLFEAGRQESCLTSQTDHAHRHGLGRMEAGWISDQADTCYHVIYANYSNIKCFH